MARSVIASKGTSLYLIYQHVSQQVGRCNNSSPYGTFRDLIGPRAKCKSHVSCVGPLDDETRQRIYAGFLQFKYNSKQYTALEQLNYLIVYAQHLSQVPNWHEADSNVRWL